MLDLEEEAEEAEEWERYGWPGRDSCREGFGREGFCLCRKCKMERWAMVKGG
jgi:hypothetical protein